MPPTRFDFRLANFADLLYRIYGDARDDGRRHFGGTMLQWSEPSQK